jgi:hypothetical protein
MVARSTHAVPYGDPGAAALRLPLRRVLSHTIALGLALVAGFASAGTATRNLQLVGYTAMPAGPSRGTAQTIPQAATPTAVMTGANVTVSWTPTTLSGGTPAEGYTVRRNTTGGALQVIGTGCSGTVAATSCIEASVPAGSWRYSVQAVRGSWRGAESALSAPITVTSATLTLPTTPITVLPATLPGSISGFTAGETLTFRLDSTTGPVLSGTPATAPAGGSGSVSVTIPAGTNDEPHSVFAIGSSGRTAAASIDVSDSPTLVSMVGRDVNGNGKVDRVVATFDEPLAPYTAGVAPWTLANVPSGGSLGAVSVSGATATLTLSEGPGASTTAMGTFTVALSASATGIRDQYDHVTSFAATAVADQAAPAAISIVMRDANTNGKVDQVVVTFSETVATYSAGTAPWTLTAVPSGGTLGSVVVGGTTATLTLTEGSGAADTAVGSFTVAHTGSATGVRDSAGNLTTFSASPTDGAKPVRVTSDMYDLDLDGRVDRVTATFTEPLAPYSAGTGVWALTSAPSGATLNSVSVSGPQAILDLDEGTGAATTAVGSFRTALTASATGVRDTAGNQASYSAVAPTDRAAPALLTLNLLDSNTNGKVDRVTAVFSETLASYTAGSTPWTLANVPSGGTISTVSTSTATATIVLTEGAGAEDTAVGSMTIGLTASATGIRDAAGNLTSLTPSTPLDAAKPTIVTVSDTNGTSDGRVEPGDTLTLTFSEPLAPGTVPATTSVVLTDPSGSGSDTLALVGLLASGGSTGSNLYITTDNTAATFAGSTVSLTGGGRVVTVTVGPTCAGTGCSAIGQATAAATLSVVPAATLTDLIGNAASAVARTFSIRLF